MLKDDLNPCRASSQNVLKTLSFGIWVGFVPFGLSAWLGLFGAWNEHARGPWSLPSPSSHFQHAECTCGALRLDRRIKCIDEIHNLWLDLDDILSLGLHPGLLLLLDLLQLGGKVVWLERVEDGEQEVAVAGGLTVEALVRNVGHHGWLRCTVVQDFSVGELLVARDFDLAELFVLEVALAAVEQGTDELHGAVAPLREVDLACRRKKMSGKICGLTFHRERIEEVFLVGDFARKLVERKLLVAGRALAFLVVHEGSEVDGSLAWAALLVADDVWTR